MRPRTKGVYIVILLGTIAWVATSMLLGGRDLDIQQAASLRTAKNAVAPPAAKSAQIKDADGYLLAIALDPFARLLPNDMLRGVGGYDSVSRLRALHRADSLSKAAIDAAQSDDPVLWAQSAHMVLLCSNPKLASARLINEAMLRQMSPDDRESYQLLTQAKPLRLLPPPEIRAEYAAGFALAWEKLEDPEVQRMQRARMRALAPQLLAPVSAAEVAAYDATRAAAAAQCPDMGFSEEFSAAYRAGREKWLSQGAMSAQLFNAKAGWSSGRNFSSLNDADFALVQRVIDERSPDGLTALFSDSGGPTGPPDFSQLPEGAVDLALVNNLYVSRLVRCELGLSNCDQSSPMFKDACLTVGGCDQADLGALLRYVLQRDGVDPVFFDQQTQYVLRAINAGDLDALGIHRRSPPQ